MADISQIQTPDGTSYDIKDTTSRSGLADKMDKVNPTGSGKMLFNAVSTSTGGSHSVCLSYGSDAKNSYSSCLGGRGLVTGRNYQTVLGYYNEEDTSSAVVVGWGSSTTHKNIFTLSTAGNGEFAGTVEATGLGATLKQAVIDAIYPVGSIYMTVSDNTVAKVQARFGGTWVAWGKGRVPLAMGNNGTTNYTTVEATGGNEQVLLDATQVPLPEHTHTLSTLNLNVSKVSGTEYGFATGATFKGDIVVSQNTGTYKSAALKNATISKTSKAQGAYVSLMQPYITCYMWKRTA